MLLDEYRLRKLSDNMDKTFSVGLTIIVVGLNAENFMNMECNRSREVNNRPGSNFTSPNYQHMFNISHICRQINQVDDTISRILDTVPRYGGNTLLSNIRAYNGHLSRVLDYLKLDKETTKRVAEDLLKKGSAKYLKVDTVKEMLTRRFQWKTCDFEVFEHLRHDTIETWYDIITLAFKHEGKYSCKSLNLLIKVFRSASSNIQRFI